MALIKRRKTEAMEKKTKGLKIHKRQGVPRSQKWGNKGQREGKLRHGTERNG